MTVVIAGAHGRVARRLTRRLTGEGVPVRALIRNPAHEGDVRGDGAEAVVCDLESAGVEEVAAAIRGADAVVFAAGAGSGSGAARKGTMDRDGAIRLLRAAEQAAVPRYVMVSTVGAEDPPAGEGGMGPYLRAKAEADRALAGSALDWTILRPGPLTDDPGTGSVRLSAAPFRGEVTRDDVAEVLAAVLAEPAAGGLTLYLGAGDEPVRDALRAAVR
jgi:uncharacterized protein YbjT (DUF2867 family)